MEPTTSCCPQCGQLLKAKKVISENRVYLNRCCPQHGELSTLLSKDARRFFDQRFNAPGQKVMTPKAAADRGCPSDCGICETHQQHLCTALIEITGRCDMHCPICYFGQFHLPDISVAEFATRLDTAMAAEGGALDVLQISGGEPTLHGQFLEILQLAYNRNVKRILLNTNGLRLLRNAEIFNGVETMKDKVELYLQFDGFDETANRFLRQRNYLDEKLAIIEKCNQHQIKMGLTVTVIPENLSQMKPIIEFAARTTHVTGMTFQRFTNVSAGKQLPPNALVQEDILQAIAATGYVSYRDIVPLPCSHENCTSVSFLFVDGTNIHSLADYVDYEKHQHLIRNKIGFDQQTLASLEEILSCGCCSWLTSHLPVVKKLKRFTAGRASSVNEMKILKITVKNFMDAYSFDTQRAKKCCIGVSVGNDRIIPFCVNNIFHRGS